MNIRIKFGNDNFSNWSGKINIGKVGSAQGVKLRTNQHDLAEISLGFSIIKGRNPIGMTKIVHIVPRFVI